MKVKFNTEKRFHFSTAAVMRMLNTLLNIFSLKDETKIIRSILCYNNDCVKLMVYFNRHKHIHINSVIVNKTKLSKGVCHEWKKNEEAPYNVSINDGLQMHI